MIKPLTINMSPDEAMLVDLLITMHGYDPTQLEQLMGPDIVDLRTKIAPPIVHSMEGLIHLSSSEVAYLLAVCPISYRFLEVDVGYSLKKKLLGALIPFEIIWSEEKNATNNNSPDKDYAKDETSGGSGAREDSVPTREDLP